MIKEEWIISSITVEDMRLINWLVRNAIKESITVMEKSLEIGNLQEYKKALKVFNKCTETLGHLKEV